MKLKKLWTVGLSVLLLISLLAGCGGAASGNMSGGAAQEDGFYVTEGKSEPESGMITGDSSTAVTPDAQNQKLIVTVRMSAETEDLDTLLSWLDGRTAQLGGYLESQEIYNGSSYSSRRNRYANLTVRIPAASLEQFVEQVGQESNIVSKTRTTENITLSYVATQSRIKALETEQTRLLELLAKAADMKDLLQIEERLTQVRTELEKVTSQLKLYDNLVEYSKVHLNISEVREYTPVEEPQTVWERISTGFVNSLKDIGNGFTELFVFLVVNLPQLVLLAAVAALVILLVARKRKKKKQKPQPPAPEKPQ